MVEKAKDPKKGTVSEEDTATLLQRYSPTTVLALLQEVAHFPEAKIDWNQLVAKTSTGISNAREYQMLWHHLAYREALVEKIANGDQPLDDDSDLEYELEPFPAVSGDALAEAAASVKVLIASGFPSEPSHQNGAAVEATLTTIIPNGQSSRAHENSQSTSSVLGKNITASVSVQKQPLPPATMSTVATAEVGDANGMAPRKKRKKWSESEDLELIAAVRKHGEGNWASIIRGDFKGDRTPNQLSQRWKYIRKNNRDLNLGGPSSKLSEAQLATRHAMSVFLNMPNITAKTIGTAGANQSKFTGANATRNSALTTAAEAEIQSQKGLNPTKPYQTGLLGSTTKSQVASLKTLPKPNSNNDDMVRATAVAAGARIAVRSDAESLLKAAQAKKTVHIMPLVGSSIKSSLPGGLSTHSESQPNIHTRTGLAATPISTPISTAVTPKATQPSLKALPQANQHTPTNDTLLSKQTNGVSCSLEDEPGCCPTEKVQDGGVIAGNGLDEQVQEDKVEAPDQKAELKNSITDAVNLVGSSNIERDETDNKDVMGLQAEERQCKT